MIASIVALGGSALLVLIDFIIKSWASTVLQPMGKMDIIPGIFSFYYHENFGAAWGILQGERVLLITVTALVLLGLAVAVAMGKFRNRVALAALALIIGGGIGNLLDRIFHSGGFVIDYLYFEPINFPIFNFADCCVVCGTILLGIYLIFLEGRQPQ